MQLPRNFNTGQKVKGHDNNSYKREISILNLVMISFILAPLTIAIHPFEIWMIS
jgi:seryl-tRNA synthetase